METLLTLLTPQQAPLQQLQPPQQQVLRRQLKLNQPKVGLFYLSLINKPQIGWVKFYCEIDKLIIFAGAGVFFFQTFDFDIFFLL